ncbi:MAG: arsenosugar biosynthesis radical SAM (seleno)protein ArsS [Polyangiales bacterium]
MTAFDDRPPATTSADDETRGRLQTLRARAAPLASAEAQRARLRSLPIARDFDEALAASGQPPLRPSTLRVLQMNLGRLCNQTCRHCHVDAGPDRTESMARPVIDACLRFLERSTVETVDITGGAPELHPDFRYLVEEIRRRGRHVMDRCNLTVLETGPCRDLPEFLARNRVELVCSLPHYRALATDRQRGEGVHAKSLSALRRLNALGYGDGRSGLRLVLVTNPVGAFLPSGQASLEAEWKRELDRLHGIRFDALYTLTNMPIARYLEWLDESGNLEPYLQKLVSAFNEAAAGAVMCRDTLSVGWDGTLYDCDFNQMLELRCAVDRPSILDVTQEALAARTVVTDRHCFGCTAGAGSSCGGALT